MMNDISQTNMLGSVLSISGTSLLRGRLGDVQDEAHMINYILYRKNEINY